MDVEGVPRNLIVRGVPLPLQSLRVRGRGRYAARAGAFESHAASSNQGVPPRDGQIYYARAGEELGLLLKLVVVKESHRPSMNQGATLWGAGVESPGRVQA